jgi:hypothetical protein
MGKNMRYEFALPQLIGYRDHSLRRRSSVAAALPMEEHNSGRKTFFLKAQKPRQPTLSGAIRQSIHHNRLEQKGPENWLILGDSHLPATVPCVLHNSAVLRHSTAGRRLEIAIILVGLGDLLIITA